MSGEGHRRYRRLFHRAFRDDIVDECVPAIGAIVASGLRELAADCARTRTAGSAPRPILEELAARAMIRVFFGLEPNTPGGESIAAAALRMPDELRGGARSASRRQAKAASATIADEIRRQGALLSEGDASAAPSFLAELVRHEPRGLEDPTVVLNLTVLVHTASTDVTGLLHWIVKLLGDNPGWLGRVRESATPGALSQRIVLESLRLQQSEFILRRVLETFELDGFVVPAGWNLRVCVHESHRDPSVFDRPDRFDPDRFEQHFTRRQYSPFGALEHTCLGVRTTHAIADAFVEQLACDYELEVVADGPPDFRFHWRPSHRHRVVLRHRPHRGVGESPVRPAQHPP
jgi:cytochrome P450